MGYVIKICGLWIEMFQQDGQHSHSLSLVSIVRFTKIVSASIAVNQAYSLSPGTGISTDHF